MTFPWVSQDVADCRVEAAIGQVRDTSAADLRWGAWGVWVGRSSDRLLFVCRPPSGTGPSSMETFASMRRLTVSCSTCGSGRVCAESRLGAYATAMALELLWRHQVRRDWRDAEWRRNVSVV